MNTPTPKLNLFDLTMIVISLVIGMGIFRTAKDSAEAALTPSIYFGAWIVGGLAALCGALTYAEIGSRFPVTGGYYKIFAECYHPSVAFAINCIMLISHAASLSAIALVGSEYFTQAFFTQPADDFTKALIAMAALVAFYLVNLAGLRLSSKTQNVLMLMKIGMLLVLLSGLFFPSRFQPPATAAATTASFGWIDYLKSFGVALVAVSYTYGGYQQTINFGDEIKNPRKTIPRAIMLGIAVIITLYLLVQVVYFKVIGFEELKTSRGIAAIVVERLYGPTAKYVFSLFLFTAVLAFVNVLLLSNPRVMYAMSLDGILPAPFKTKNQKRDVVTVSLTVFTTICVVVLFVANTFNQIMGFAIFLDAIGMVTSAATIFILRKRTRHLDGTGIYQMKLYPLMPLVFIASYTVVGASILINTPMLALIGLGVFAFFLLTYFLTRKLRTPAKQVNKPTALVRDE